MNEPVRIKFAQKAFAETPALAGNVLKSPPYLKFYGSADIVANYGNGIVPNEVTLFAHPIEVDIPEYPHKATEDIFEVTVTNNNQEPINRESFKVRGRVDELLDNIDVSLRVVRTSEVRDRYDPSTQASGSHPIAFPVANKIRNAVVKYALDALGSTPNDDIPGVASSETICINRDDQGHVTSVTADISGRPDSISSAIAVADAVFTTENKE